MEDKEPNEKLKEVFVVGVSDAEANSVSSIHRTHEGALKAWNEERKRLIVQFKQLKFYEVARGSIQEYNSRWNKYINNLQCEDPEKMGNYPLDEPYIAKYKLFD